MTERWIGRLFVHQSGKRQTVLQSEWGFALAMHPRVMEKQLREKQALSLFQHVVSKCSS
ncbi:MAG: hypothetical protein IPJ38_21035 [Dechloromonas sp.]|uniref:Uncharacterized protein n=1 Tax=Candidatus Dechloromonas phosphorivorans TaxID=2899244 RepID=A0A935K0Z1_9RHOO|nr:hypothetical protein [Candidatus Dechloromonas phosphorivorans]